MIDRLGGGKRHVARDKQHVAVMQIESLQDRFRACHHLVEDLVALFGLGEGKHLHFVELMHADQAPLLRASRARFSAKTRSIGDEFFRKLFFFEDLIVIQSVEAQPRTSG